MKLKYTLAALAATSVAANATVIANYNADAGNPANAGEVLNPLAAASNGNTQWLTTDPTLSVNDIQTGTYEGGQGGWQNLDSADNNNPGYRTILGNTQFQDMFDNGWTMTIRLSMQEGGQFVAVGGDDTNTGGNFAFPGDRRVGASFNTIGDDFTVTAVGTGGSAVTVTDGILNNTYIRVVITGEAGTDNSTWQLFNDDTDALLSTQSLTGWATGNNSTDDNVTWASGSSSGDNRTALYREVSLVTVPEPSSAALLGLGGLALILRRRK
ncbi:PEP-CTERM sorting domain-containing protein [Oceaniferula spumae]